MKRATCCIIAVTMLIGSCQEDETPDGDNSGNLKSTVSFKVNGTLFNLSKDFDDDSNFPSFIVFNSSTEGLIVQFGIDGLTTFQFAGTYVANSSHDFTDGEMLYAEHTAEGKTYDSYSDDDCGNDSFSFRIQKQNAGIDYLPMAVRFTGTFSGLLVSREQPLDPDEPLSPICLGPEVQITDGSFSVIGISD